MHILWVKTELLHPIDKGGRIRTYNMLRALKQQHRVTYLTLDNGRAAPDARESAEEYCHDLIRVDFPEARRKSPRFWFELAANIVSPLPYAVAKYQSARMRQEVHEAVKRLDIDLLVCDFLFPSQSVPAGLPCRTVLFQHNVEAMIWKRHAEVRTNPVSRGYFREQWRRMERFERSECRRFDQVVAVSRADAETMEKEYGLASVSDVPTGVDTDYFRPAGRTKQEPRRLVFTGAMDWMPNEDGIGWFVDEVLPLIHAKMPDVTVTIVGRNPPASIRARAERDQRLLVTGSVPDVRPFMESGSVFVVPLRVGGGTRLKIFEALAMERPLVSTTIGAEGLPIENGVHALIADGAGPFADAVLQLLSNPDRASTMAHDGAHYVRSQFSWERAAERFVDLVTTLTPAKR